MSTKARVALLALAALSACGGADLMAPSAASDIAAAALTIHTARVSWKPGSEVGSYRLYRRRDLKGTFDALGADLSRSVGEYVDTGLVADTRYGYRLEAFDRQGKSMGMSTVVGVKTPPPPGLLLRVGTSGPPSALDPNGYSVRLEGPRDTVQTAIAATPVASHLFQPLANGAWRVTVTGLAASCTPDDSLTRSTKLSDQVLRTVDTLSIGITCKDATLGDLAVKLTTTGELLPVSYGITLTGIIPGSSRPELEQRAGLPVNGTVSFAGLKPGDYQLQLTGVPANCTAQPGTTIDGVTIAADQLTQRAIAVDCIDPDAAKKPFVVRNTFATAPSTPGAVALTVAFDASARSGQGVSAFQGTLQTDVAVLRFDSATAGQLNTIFQTLEIAPGVVRIVTLKSSPVRTGNVKVGQLWYTVLPAAQNGATTTTFTTLESVAGNGPADLLIDSTRVVEGKFTVGGSSGGPGTNQPPIARAGGPYSGTVGQPVSFTGGASSDPDGTIASYAWSFGDGATATGATPGHAYASSAGSPYTATLTVTDDRGATAIGTATVTIGGSGGGGNQPPTANAGGPYSGTANAPVALNGAASSDPDGSIVSYSWNFGNGQSGSGVSPTVTYAAAGTYAVTLTVTDNGAATSTASTTVTVAPAGGGGGGGQPFTWSSTFAPVGATQVELTVMLDLSTDIPETPGAEALASWGVVQLHWDPAVLQFFSLNIDSGSPGGFNFTNAAQGSISFSGNVDPARSQGVIQLARVRFTVVGAPGSSTTTASSLGLVVGTPATGSFSYGSKIHVVEGSYTVP